MPTVRELFLSLNWEDVADALAALYPDETPRLSSYRQVFERMRSCPGKPHPENLAVRVRWVQDEDEGWHDVSGVVPGDPLGRALEFCTFGEWAGFGVDPETLETYRPAEAAAHMLYEMTFCGFSDEEILAAREEILGAAEEARREVLGDVPAAEGIRQDGRGD